MSILDGFSFDTMEPGQMMTSLVVDYAGTGLVRTTGRTGQGLTGTAGASTLENTLRTKVLYPLVSHTGYHGMAIKALSLPAAETKIWALLADDASVQATVTLMPSGTIRVYSGSFETGTLLGTSGLIFVAASVFRYLEMGHILSGEGRFEVRSTPNTGGTARQFVVTGATSPRAWAQVEYYLTEDLVIDDVYLVDVGGPFGPNYFAGNLTVQVSRPLTVISEGSWFNSFPWLPNTGSDKIAVVDDVTMDGDATYNTVGISLTTLEADFEDVTPDDGREIQDVKLTAVVRSVSSAVTWFPQLLIHRYDGALISAPQPAMNRTIYTALSVLWRRTGGFGSLPFTIERLNNSNFVVRS